jgi:hypothetical protein
MMVKNFWTRFDKKLPTDDYAWYLVRGAYSYQVELAHFTEQGIIRKGIVIVPPNSFYNYDSEGYEFVIRGYGWAEVPEMDDWKLCNQCKGSGRISIYNTCPLCGGSGLPEDVFGGNR